MISVRRLHKSEYDAWLTVYRFYADHYQVTLTDSSAATTWGWLMDAKHPLKGIAAVDEGRLVGLAHYRAMPNPLRGANIGFLDDLVVRPEERGGDAAKLLLKELKSIGKQEQWSKIRWITRENNYRARSLYDHVASKTDWAMYEMEP